MPDGQVVFEITGDNRPVQQVLRDTTSAIERESRNWDRSVDDSTENMSRAFNRAFDVNRIKTWALDAGKAILDFAKGAVQAASDLQEVQNVVDTTFGSSSGKIDSWAKNAIKQFGLTETQAKRFASTLGAMAKSAGVAGPEIVQMSTDLAGLAADMASFYNLDFDTAFQKIRSGISGETEPLKQLGINMSVANLNAYALAQGLEKTFDQMDQAEQTMLRYQYIMQATSDAQGDFARTSDGFANGMRLLESNVDSLKTKLGNLLIGPVSDFISGMNGLVDTLFPTETHERTVLGDFADIDLQTNQKIASIQATADKALALVQTLNDISGETVKSTGLTSMVDSLANHFGGMEEAMNAAESGDYAGTISKIASALSLETGADSTKWENLLNAIGDNLGDVTNVVGTDGSQTSDWLTAAAQAADDLGGEYPALWQSLVDTLGGDAAAEMVKNFAGATTGENKLTVLAEAANALESGSASNWSRFLTTVQDVSGITNLFGQNADSAAENIKEIASALSGGSVTTTRAKAWETLLGALSENASGLTGLTGKSAEDTRDWLNEMAAAAASINPEDAQAWNTFMGAFLQGLPGLGNTEDGQSAMEALLHGAQGVGDAANAAIGYLSMFGIESDDIADAQSKWLEVCRRLVHEIPGLSSIINTQTGEVEGGTQAIKDYIEAWQQSQEDVVWANAVQQRKAKLDEANAELTEKQIDREVAQRKYNKKMDELNARGYSDEAINTAYNSFLNAGGVYKGLHPDEPGVRFDNWLGDTQDPRDWTEWIWNDSTGQYDKIKGAELLEIAQLVEDWGAASDAVDAYTAANAQALEEQEIYNEMLSESVQRHEEENRLQEEHNKLVNDAATAIDAATTALGQMSDYMAAVREETASSVSSMIKGFEGIVTPAQKARDEMEKLGKVNEDGSINERWESLNNTIATIGNMTANLNSQAQYMDEYMAALEKAKSMGYDADMLAQLADGSAESYDYLQALTKQGITQEQIEGINTAWQTSQSKQQEFIDSLTQTKLNADEEFQSLAQSASDAIAELDQYSEASNAMAQTVQGIADGIASKIPEVQTQVDALNAVLSTLAGLSGIGYGWLPRVGVNTYNVGKGWLSGALDGSHAVGLDYVPFDNYLAALHEGESVLTAEEARVWRNFKTGSTSSRNNIDYGALSGAIWDSAPAMGGGNVYLDGRTVGRVISGAQADSYRALERSGWQG